MRRLSLTIEDAAGSIPGTSYRSREGEASHRTQALTWVCALVIASATLLLKLSIPPFGARGISISLFLLPAIAVLGLIARALDIDATRLAPTYSVHARFNKDRAAP